MNKLIIWCASMAAVLSTFAGTFALKDGVSGVFDWTDGANYVGDVAPDVGAGNEVIVPPNTDVVIDKTMASASFSLLNALDRIRPDTGARVIFIVGKDEELDVSVPINHNTYSSDRGTVVKQGEGTLRLLALGKWKLNKKNPTDYQVNFDVQAGQLFFNLETGLEEATQIQYLGMNVEAGATVHLPYPGSTSVSFFTGGGDITNRATVAPNGYSYYTDIIIRGEGEEPHDFSGRLRGGCGLVVSGHQYLTGKENVIQGSTSIKGYDGSGTKGILGVAALGKAAKTDAPTSMPAGNVLMRDAAAGKDHGGKLVYLGTGEITDKNFLTYPPKNAVYNEISGGTNGALVLTGKIQLADTPTVRPFILSGDGPAVNILSNTIDAVDAGGIPCSHTFIKRGKGTWRFAANQARTTAGLLAVEDGTIEFEDIAEKGTACSLGTSAAPYPVDASGAPSGLTQVDYAFLLGSHSSTGTFAYVGRNAALCATRTIALNGTGRLQNDSASEMRWCGVKGLAGSGSTLLLSGEGADRSANTLSDVSGDVSIVKEGTRPWTLVGNQAFTGSLRVKAGTLVCRNAYSWYRWTIKSNQGGDGLDIYAYAVGIFDAEGHDLAPKLTARASELNNYSSAAGDWWTATVNEVMCGRAIGAFRIGNPYSVLFNGQSSPVFKAYWQLPGGGYEHHNDPTAESSWLPLVCRFAADEKLVCGYDVGIASSAAYVGRWLLEGSADGVSWDPLHEQSEQATPKLNGWYYANRAIVDNEERHVNTDGEVDYKAVRSAPADAADFLANCSAVSVDAGATLKIVGEVALKGLAVDPQGAGTIEGGTLAETGTIEVLGDVREAVELPLDLSKIGGTANLTNWQVKIGGVVKKWSVSVVDNKIVLTPPGMMLILR